MSWISLNSSDFYILFSFLSVTLRIIIVVDGSRIAYWSGVAHLFEQTYLLPLPALLISTPLAMFSNSRFLQHL